MSNPTNFVTINKDTNKVTGVQNAANVQVMAMHYSIWDGSKWSVPSSTQVMIATTQNNVTTSMTYNPTTNTFS